MFFRFLLTLVLTVFVFQGFSQAKMEEEENAPEDTSKELYLSAYTKDKDTLYLADNSMGHTIKKAWDMSDTAKVERPEIVFLKKEQIKALREKREDIVVPESEG